MMWKRSIVQVNNIREFIKSTWLLSLCIHTYLFGTCHSADLVIEIPGSGGAEGGEYRLDYGPPQGVPPPNFKVPAQASTINFQGLPGTKYHFMLYYSNATIDDLLTWNQTIITAPEPPTDLSVSIGRNKIATISWSPPAQGDYTGFRFKVIPLTERVEGGGGARNITVEGSAGWSHTLRDLSPGATYQLHAFTLLHDKESAAYASRNFTTKPNTPGKFIVWFRNETTLLVLWQPPYPPGAYTHYKVSILPPDARESELYVEKEGEPPGPAQAAFKGLVPGRAYNISVQTVAEPELSPPTTALYRTVPLRPRDLAAPSELRAETAFTLVWTPPPTNSEFEKYQISVSGSGSGAGSNSGSRRPAPLVRLRDEPATARFEGLEPGAKYTATVKTMSGKVTSWPATLDLTLKPLPVRDIRWRHLDGNEGVKIWWEPAEGSTQDEYKVSYHESGPSRDDSNTLTVSTPNVVLDSLLPGRNYSVWVSAVSGGVEGNASAMAVASRPLAPVLREATPENTRLQLAWWSDVNSKQDRYALKYARVRDGKVTDEYNTLETRETNATFENLFPGAVYEFQLMAVSHGLFSEPHTVLEPTRPFPPAWMEVSLVTSNSALVRWAGPPPSTSALGEFSLRYRTQAGGKWARLPPLPPNSTEAEVVDMTHGERYAIQLDTASESAAGERVDSTQPLTQYHTVRPNPVSNVASLVDTRNITLEWPRPKGRVERYSLQWSALSGELETPDETHYKNISVPESEMLNGGEGGSGPGVVRAALGNLAPGVGYSIAVAAHSYNLTSDTFTMETRTRPLIQSEMTIVNESGDSDDNDTLPGFLVIYTRTPTSASRFDSYRFRLEAVGAPPRELSRAATAPGQQLAFRQLTPGRLYNLTMWCVSNNVTSHPVQRQARLFPRPIPSLNTTKIDARQITLSWEKPDGDYTEFAVQYLAGEDELESTTTDQLNITLQNLKPYTMYTFTVEVVSGTPASLVTRSRGVSLTARTAAAPPGAPRALRVTDARPASASLAWDLPADQEHGPIQRWRAEVAPQGQPEKSTLLEFPGSSRSGTITGLAAGGAYSVRVWAESAAGAGAAARLALRLPIAAPPRPAPASVPSEVRHTTTTVAVRFRSDYFSAANGNVTAYSVILAESPGNETGARLPAWRDVQRLPVWPPYQVTEPYYPFHSSTVEQFTIGSERCEPGGRAYCNGPLKPGTTYYVKLRAFTAPDKYTDTAYALVYTDADNTAWIAGALTLAAVAVCAGAVFLIRRRRASNGGGGGRTTGRAPQPRLSRPVRVQDFRDHYRLMSADSDFRFSEEFEELKHIGREQPTTAADLPCNRPKNRFTNILPYDHSRYKLQPVDDEEGSDYINANYVPGHNSPREFIVTQGPLHCTRDDFWRMCWESASRAIVMLTRCVEKGREKCDRYWPYDTLPMYYGDISVTALNETHLPDWTVSELLVSRGNEQRVLLHFHFITWPDFGVPDPPTALVRFVRAFRTRVPAGSGGPVVVHCSAGVGRSGTFITLDRALLQLTSGAESLDIFGMVAGMRRERVWMVQTEQQYICVHTCVAAVLDGQADHEPPRPHHNAAFDDDEGIAESGM